MHMYNYYKGSILQYLQQCEELETGQHDHCSKQYGINNSSTITSAPARFWLLEGVLQVEVKLVLQYCIHTFGLNELISNFELGYMESTKRPTPTPIKKSTTLHWSRWLVQM